MKRALVLVVTLISLAVTSAFARTADAKPTIAILGLEAVEGGTDDALTAKFAEQLTKALRQRARAPSSPFTIVGSAGNKDLMEMKLLSNCETEETACMAAIGHELQAQRLLYGKVEKLRDGIQVSLKLLNVEKKSPMRTVTEVVPTGEASGAAVDDWGKKLYSTVIGGSNQGSLVVSANVDRGTVYLDQNVKGTMVAGTLRIDALPAGEHTLMVEADCYLRREQSVVIEGDKETSLQVTLDRNQIASCDQGSGSAGDGTSGNAVAPKVPVDDNASGRLDRRIIGGDLSSEERPGGNARALFWTSTAVAALGAGSWVYGYSQIKSNEGACPVGSTSDSDDPECKAGFRGRTFTQVGIPVTIAAGVAASYFFYRGYIAASRSGSAVAARRRGRSILVAPTVSAVEVGGVVRIEF